MEGFENERYSRLETIHWWPKEKIRPGRALLGGCGAIGNEVAKNLALMGFGHILAVDRDRVEQSNLTRSILFREGDIGRPKAEVVAQRAREIDPSVKVASFYGNIADLGLGVYRQMDLIFSDFDGLFPRLLLARQCRRVGKGLINAGLSGIDVLRGQVDIYGPDGVCFGCYLPPERITMALEEGGGLGGGCGPREQAADGRGFIPSTPTMASLIGALQVQEGLRTIMDNPALPPSYGHLILVDTVLCEMKRYIRKPVETCTIHGNISPIPAEEITELPGFNSRSTQVGKVLEKAREDLGGKACLRLPHDLVLQAQCSSCYRKTEKIFQSNYRFKERIKEGRASCPFCKVGTLKAVDPTSIIGVEAGFLDLTLAKAGLRPLDILEGVTMDGEEERSIFYEITGDRKDILGFE